jgi:ADP-heptose:LPS heptosyltransferase
MSGWPQKIELPPERTASPTFPVEAPNVIINTTWGTAAPDVWPGIAEIKPDDSFVPATISGDINWPPIPELPALRRWAGVARMGGVGDNLVAASVLPLLKKQGFMTEVISQPPFSCIFHNNPHIDRLIEKEKEDWPQDFKEWQAWFASRSKEYARFCNLSHTMEHLLAFFPAQTAFSWPAHFRRKLANHSYVETVHDALDVPYEFAPMFFPTDEEKEGAIKTKKWIGCDKIIGWCISGTRVDKSHPYSPMIVARLIKEIGLPVVLMGAPGKDYELALQIQQNVERTNGSRDNLHIAISNDTNNPNWPVRRILAFTEVCDLMIGPDTGPMWAVAFHDMPKIVLLSHASPENITKHWKNTTTMHANPARVPCWPCHLLHDTHLTCFPNKENTGAACVSDISTEMIVQQAFHLLK